MWIVRFEAGECKNMKSPKISPLGVECHLGLPGGPWDLELLITGMRTILITGVTPISPFKGIISRVTRPMISSYCYTENLGDVAGA